MVNVNLGCISDARDLYITLLEAKSMVSVILSIAEETVNFSFIGAFETDSGEIHWLFFR